MSLCIDTSPVARHALRFAHGREARYLKADEEYCDEGTLVGQDEEVPCYLGPVVAGHDLEHREHRRKKIPELLLQGCVDMHYDTCTRRKLVA